MLSVFQCDLIETYSMISESSDIMKAECLCHSDEMLVSILFRDFEHYTVNGNLRRNTDFCSRYSAEHIVYPYAYFYMCMHTVSWSVRKILHIHPSECFRSHVRMCICVCLCLHSRVMCVFGDLVWYFVASVLTLNSLSVVCLVRATAPACVRANNCYSTLHHLSFCTLTHLSVNSPIHV